MKPIKVTSNSPALTDGDTASASATVIATLVAFILMLRALKPSLPWLSQAIGRGSTVDDGRTGLLSQLGSILVPFPHAVDDHQTSNARFLSSAGAAILLPQDQLTPERVAEIRNLSRSQLAQMAEKARELARPDATAVVAHACAELAK